MKKILFGIILMFSLFSCAQAKTDDTKIELNNLYDYYYEIKGDNLYSSNFTSVFYANGKIAYCIEPGVGITTTIYDSSKSLNLSKEKSDYLELLGYFGYEYPTHKTTKYYLATQELIWEYVKKVSVKFTTAKNGMGSEIDLSKEKNDILRLINNYKKNPSFNKEMLSIKNTNELIDSNNVLKDYEVISSDINATISGNKLILSSDEVGSKNIKLKYKKYTNETTLVYSKGSSQKMATLRLSSDKLIDLSFDFKSGSVKIIKSGEKLNSGYNYEMVFLKDVIFGLYDLNNNIINEFSTDENGVININNLSFGRYYVKEISNKHGHLLDPNKYYFEISKDNLNESISLKNYLPKGNVEIIKMGENNKRLDGAVFELYTESGELIATEKTKNGVIKFKDLSFGKYYLKEVIAPNGYSLDSSNHYFEVSSETELLNIELFNDLIIDVPITGKNDYLYIFLGILFALFKRIS